MLVVISWAAPGAYGTTFSGSLSYGDGVTGLQAAGDYAAASTSIAWVISNDDDCSIWHYRYTLTLPTPSPAGSHMMIGATPDVFTLDDLLTISGEKDGEVEVEVWEPTLLKPNPFLPGDVYAVKVGMLEAGGGIIDFTTEIGPAWRDWYVVGGSYDPEDDTMNFGAAWNAGFLLADPLVSPGDTNVTDHILGIDSGPGGSGNGVIPEPLTMLGLFLGLGGIGAYIRRRRMG